MTSKHDTLLTTRKAMRRTSFNLTFKSSLAICYCFCLSTTAFCICWYVCKNVQLCAVAAIAATLPVLAIAAIVRLCDNWYAHRAFKTEKRKHDHN